MLGREESSGDGGVWTGRAVGRRSWPARRTGLWRGGEAGGEPAKAKGYALVGCGE